MIGRRRRRPIARVALLLVTVLALVPAGGARAASGLAERFLAEQAGNGCVSVDDEAAAGRYALVVLGCPPLRLAGVLDGGVEVWRGGDEAAWEVLAFGRDVTGDGVADLLLGGYSGGAHCCTTYYPFSLGDRFVELPPFVQGHGAPGAPLWLDDGRAVLLSLESIFAYWRACFACSPLPPVYATFRRGRFRLDPGLMRAPAAGAPPALMAEAAWLRWAKDRGVRPQDAWPLSPVALAPLADELRGALDDPDPDALPPTLWGTMLSLIYTGHADEAWRFLTAVWPAERPGQEAFARDFLGQLSLSRHWPELLTLNGSALLGRWSDVTALGLLDALLAEDRWDVALLAGDGGDEGDDVGLALVSCGAAERKGTLRLVDGAGVVRLAAELDDCPDTVFYEDENGDGLEDLTALAPRRQAGALERVQHTWFATGDGLGAPWTLVAERTAIVEVGAGAGAVAPAQRITGLSLRVRREVEWDEAPGSGPVAGGTVQCTLMVRRPFGHARSREDVARAVQAEYGVGLDEEKSWPCGRLTWDAAAGTYR